MEFWKIVLPLTGLALTLLVIAFRQRQLYLLVPKLFEYSPLSNTGKVVGMTVLNRSWFMEEDLRIEMPTKFSVELVASDALGVEKNKGFFTIHRLPQRSQVTLVFLIEGNEIPTELLPKLTSKTSKGRLVRNGGPPNYGIMAAIAVLYLSFMAAMVYSSEGKLAELERKKQELKLSVADAEKERERQFQETLRLAEQCNESLAEVLNKLACSASSPNSQENLLPQN